MRMGPRYGQGTRLGPDPFKMPRSYNRTRAGNYGVYRMCYMHRDFLKAKRYCRSCHDYGMAPSPGLHPAIRASRARWEIELKDRRIKRLEKIIRRLRKRVK